MNDKNKKIYVILLTCIFIVIFVLVGIGSCGGIQYIFNKRVETVNAEEDEDIQEISDLEKLGFYNGSIYFSYSLGGQKMLQPNLLSCFLDPNTYEPVDIGYLTFQNTYYYFPNVVVRNTDTNELIHIFPAFDYLIFTLVHSSIYGYMGYIVGDTFYPFVYNISTNGGYPYSSAFDIDILYYERLDLSGDSYSINFPIRLVFKGYDSTSNYSVYNTQFCYQFSDSVYDSYTCCSIDYVPITYVPITGLFPRFVDIQVSYDLADFKEVPDSIYGNYFLPNDLLYSVSRLISLYDIDGDIFDVSNANLSLLDNGMPNYLGYSRGNFLLEIICNYSFANGYMSSARKPTLKKNNEVISSYRLDNFILDRNNPLPFTYPPAQVDNFPNYTNLGLPPYVRYIGFTGLYDKGWKYGLDVGKGYGRELGWNEGYDEGYEEGKQDGFNEGLENGGARFVDLIGAVIDVPIKSFIGLTDVEILGFTMTNLYKALFGFALGVMIVRLIL